VQHALRSGEHARTRRIERDLPRGGRRREIVLELPRREIPQGDTADDTGRRRPRDCPIGNRLEIDGRDAPGIGNISELGQVVASDVGAEAQPPTAEDTRIAGSSVDDREAPHAAHALVGELRERRAPPGLERERLNRHAVAARHGHGGRSAARRRQRHEQLGCGTVLEY
jgi:hypothetical protein